MTMLHISENSAGGVSRAGPCIAIYETPALNPKGRKEQRQTMSTFDEREKGFEAKYKHDQEIQFKVTARRNRLLGLWAAEQLGLSGAEADAYAKSVVVADFEKPGDEDVVGKVMADLSAKGVQITEHALRRRIAEFMDLAREQIKDQMK